MSRRLTCEVTNAVRRSQFSNIFFFKSAWPIIAKSYVKPPCVKGMKVCLRYLGHMTKMVATPIYGKNPYMFSSPDPKGMLL